MYPDNLKSARTTLKSYRNFFPEPKLLSALTTVDELGGAAKWYITLNFNFRVNILPGQLKILIAKLEEINDSTVKIQPIEDLHCSLHSIYVYDNKKICEAEYHPVIETLKTIYDKHFHKQKFGFDIDLLFLTDESLAIQVFPKTDLLLVLNEFQDDIAKEMKKDHLVNEPKIHGDTRGVINLIRFNNAFFESDISAQKIINIVNKFNEKTMGRDTSFCTAQNIVLNIVKSDNLFDKKNGSKILYP